ncbi:hypothetical protein [Vibrio campbellii]|uniref:hypothetical protein n=1 Tax=Vibrio campbellii TaxID=680 RepID=UPI0005EE8AC2|nr:hypothetical protein [Vibrio campbellii]
MKKKLFAALVLSLIAFTTSANMVVSEGQFVSIKCTAVGYDPVGDPQDYVPWEDNYFGPMNYSITKDNEGYKMTTGLYSGQFFNVRQGGSKHNLLFIQSYNGGAEIATIAINSNIMTYTNTSGVFYNRLCVGKLKRGIVLN